MNIVNIASKFKTIQLSSCGPRQLIQLKLIVTVENGDDLIFVELFPDVHAIEQEAFKVVLKQLQEI
jgi:predicted S18 family serine protease